MKANVKAIFFDMDATVIEEESLVALAQYTGKSMEIAELTEKSMTGDIDFAESLRRRVHLFAGTFLSDVKKVASSLTLAQGIEEFCDLARSFDVELFLVSGGFLEMAEPLIHRLRMNDFICNRFEVTGKKGYEVLTGSVSGTIVDGETKRGFVKRILQSRGIFPHETAAVGDGANDIPMMSAVEFSIGFRPKRPLRSHVKHVIDSGNHMDLVPILFD